MGSMVGRSTRLISVQAPVIPDWRLFDDCRDYCQPAPWRPSSGNHEISLPRSRGVSRLQSAASIAQRLG
jgi:hypothetical protein